MKIVGCLLACDKFVAHDMQGWRNGALYTVYAKTWQLKNLGKSRNTSQCIDELNSKASRSC